MDDFVKSIGEHMKRETAALFVCPHCGATIFGADLRVGDFVEPTGKFICPSCTREYLEQISI